MLVFKVLKAPTSLKRTFDAWVVNFGANAGRLRRALLVFDDAAFDHIGKLYAQATVQAVFGALEVGAAL
jgi:hypothetical protein